MHERQLEYVIAAVELGSFTHAADHCDVSQPSLSASIARLERELGVLLFHRIGRTITPTDACEALLPSARDLIRSADATRRAAHAASEGLSGLLHIAVQPTVIGRVVDVVSQFRSAHPGVTLRVHSPGEGSVGSLITTGRAELGIGDATGDRGLEWRDLWIEPYVWVGHRDDHGTTGDGDVAAMDPERAGAAPLVVTPLGSPTRDVTDQWFASAGVAPRVAIEVDHREALIALVAAGAGATIVPRSMADAERRDELLARPLEPPVERRIGVARRHGALTPAAQHFLSTLVQHPVDR